MNKTHVNTPTEHTDTVMTTNVSMLLSFALMDNQMYIYENVNFLKKMFLVVFVLLNLKFSV